MLIEPFDPDMPKGVLARVYRRDPWRSLIVDDGGVLDRARVRRLRAILKEHARVVRPVRGTILMRKGEYGHSAFFILEGALRVIKERTWAPPDEQRDRDASEPWLRRTIRMFRRRREVEARASAGREVDETLDDDGHVLPSIVQDMDGLRASSVRVAGEGELVGEIAALSRMPRTAYVLCDQDAELVEVRWQGLHKLRRFATFKRLMDEKYHDRALRADLRERFRGLGDAAPVRAALQQGDVETALRHVLAPPPENQAAQLQVDDISLRCLAASAWRKTGAGTVVYASETPVDERTAIERAQIVLGHLDETQGARIHVALQRVTKGWHWAWTIPADDQGTRRPTAPVLQPTGSVPAELTDELFELIIGEELLRQAELRSYGEWQWDLKTAPNEAPLIVREGDHPEGLLLIRAGFARMSRLVDGEERTVSYLGPTRMFGLEELEYNYQNASRPMSVRHTLRSLGYVEAVHLPTAVVERYILPARLRMLRPGPVPRHEPLRRDTPMRAPDAVRSQAGIDRSLLHYLIEHRLTNARAAMVIDLNRCTRCDDCVRACASAHDDNPRFVRHGHVHDQTMIANACMHCADPVCMIGCPTGAIARERADGAVVIDDLACIGCAACANGCPYDNIRMVDIRTPRGGFFRTRSGVPQRKATKCDLCVGLAGGPACQRACPHDALVRVDLTEPGPLRDWALR